MAMVAVAGGGRERRRSPQAVGWVSPELHGRGHSAPVRPYHLRRGGGRISGASSRSEELRADPASGAIGIRGEEEEAQGGYATRRKLGVSVFISSILQDFISFCKFSYVLKGKDYM
jgi:hypothetical protein